MTRLIMLAGAVLVAAFWGFVWWQPLWGLGLFAAMALALWGLTRERRPAATDPARPAADSEPPPDHLVPWADLPEAVRQRLGDTLPPGHQVWAGLRPGPLGEPRTEWRHTDGRGTLVQAFWLDHEADPPAPAANAPDPGRS